MGSGGVPFFPLGHFWRLRGFLCPPKKQRKNWASEARQSLQWNGWAYPGTAKGGCPRLHGVDSGVVHAWNGSQVTVVAFSGGGGPGEGAATSVFGPRRGLRGPQSPKQGVHRGSPSPCSTGAANRL